MTVVRIANVHGTGCIHLVCVTELIALITVCFIFITLCLFLLVEFLFAVAANVVFAKLLLGGGVDRSDANQLLVHELLAA